MSMAKVGDVVTIPNYPGQTFKVTHLTGNSATIQKFDVSRQALGDLVLAASVADMRPFREDANQAAARIVRDATKGR
jgi:hypothetical protein